MQIQDVTPGRPSPAGCSSVSRGSGPRHRAGSALTWLRRWTWGIGSGGVLGGSPVASAHAGFSVTTQLPSLIKSSDFAWLPGH